jgi:hypothetical protein
MERVNFLRHSGFFSSEDATEPLNIIGVGATGSWIGLLAAKMGILKFRVWDPDVVEDHNLPNQIYDLEHIGKSKVDSFEAVVTRFNPAIEVDKHECYFTSKQKDLLQGPLVLTVDTMSARKEIYDAFYLNWQIQKIFETRLGFDYAEVNIIDNQDIDQLEEWKSNLLDDKDIPDGPCNLRTCTTLVSLISSFTVHNICSMFSAERRGEEWKPAKKTIFNLKPDELASYTIKHR